MNKNKLLSLYLKYLNPPVNIHGLILHPKLVDESIKWKLVNPDDLSYNVGVINGYIEETLYNFMKMTGTIDIPEFSDWPKYCKLSANPDKTYVNKELRTKINNACNNFNTIELIDDGRELVSDCFVKDYDFNYQNPESFNFYISLELTNPKIDGEDVNDDFLEDFFKEFIYNETSTDQELDIFWNIIRIVFDYPTMYDNSYMYSNAIVGYFDSFGNSLT
jgi:hypothetical protein